MSTQTDKIRQAIERAMARIGCPHGDNSDADLYRELQSALSGMEAQPSQTDEQLYKQAMDDVTPEALERTDKRLAAIDAQTEDLEARAREWLRTEQNTAETDDLRTNGKEVAFMLAAFARSIAPPSAPTVDQITLEGEQSDPCGTITVKVKMSDGREVEAIRTNANSIYHMVTLADPAFGK